MLCLMVVAIAGAPAATERRKGDDELRMGQEVFNKLKAEAKSWSLPLCTTSCDRLRMPSPESRSPNTTIRSSSTWCTKRSRMHSRRRAAMFTARGDRIGEKSDHQNPVAKVGRDRGHLSVDQGPHSQSIDKVMEVGYFITLE